MPDIDGWHLEVRAMHARTITELALTPIEPGSGDPDHDDRRMGPE